MRVSELIEQLIEQPLDLEIPLRQADIRGHSGLFGADLQIAFNHDARINTIYLDFITSEVAYARYHKKPKVVQMPMGVIRAAMPLRNFLIRFIWRYIWI